MPALQPSQAVIAVEPVFALYVPGAQSVHAAADTIAILYFPKAHAVTELPLPVYPASALQSANLVEPVSEPVPEWEGQSVHSSAE